MDTSHYCREIEAYLCQKNDGHLIRVVGPSFELVADWAAAGLPLKIAFRGIDRCFERYYRKGPRRRPVRIDFCEADVLDAFDEWRRAIGLAEPSRMNEPSEAAGHRGLDSAPSREAPAGGGQSTGTLRGPSLPAHLQRVLLRLTDARARGVLGPSADEFLDRVSRELDAARASGRGLRGEARRGLVSRLEELDAQLLAMAQAKLEESLRGQLEKEAEEELATFRDRLTAETYASARLAAIARLVRERFGLPTLKVP